MALFGGDYTPQHERGTDWQSEYEIRRDLYREMYGEKDLSEQQEPDQDHVLENQQEGTGLKIGL